MKAVILAGGKGTRMGDMVKDIPKPMINIAEKPVLLHQLELLKQYNITDIILTVNHLKDAIIQEYQNGEKLGLNIKYFEEEKPLGTVGAIKELEAELNEDFLVLYGDVMMNVNLDRLINFHKAKKSECTLVIHPNDHPYDSDLIELDKDDRVTEVHNKPHDSNKYYKNLVNAGLYIFSPVIFKYLEKGVKADFGKNIFPSICSEIQMFAYNTPEYLKDMGTPERTKQVTEDYLSGKIERSRFDVPKKAIFLDRDGVLNYDTDLIHKPEDLKLYDVTADAIKKINKSEYLSVVITNQSVIARNLCTIDELEYIHKKLETKLGEQRAKLDAIYYCPHHPDKGYPEENPIYKIECACRKPKPGMFLDAAKDLNINLSESYMIGDSERDIIAGKNAGCVTVGVMTGNGVKKTKEIPDYFFKDIKQAADFIVDRPYDNILNRILDDIKARDKKPYIINISGNAKSGKSILASFLAIELKKKGVNVTKIELDNWLLKEDQRDHCKNVYDRFQINKIDKDITDLINGKSVIMESYSNHDLRQSRNIEYNITDSDVVIIDGIVSLGSKKLREYSDFKVFMKIDENSHKQRIIDYYNWRNKKPAEIEELYQKRKQDEYQLIEKESNFADLVIE